MDNSTNRTNRDLKPLHCLHSLNNPGTLSTAQNQTRCLQIKLQHSRSATYNLMKVIETEEPDLILVQQPYEYQNRPIGIDKKYRIFMAGNGKHRAAIIIIIINSKIDAILITKISDERHSIFRNNT